MDTIKGLKRTHMCVQAAEALNQNVCLMGWVNKRRNLGQLIFITLRDQTGSVQIVVNQDKAGDELVNRAKETKSEYVIAVRGLVLPRGEKDINPHMVTGQIEVEALEIRILSKAQTPPFSVADTGVKDDLRLKYRYLDLRREKMQYNLILRHKIARSIREFLNNEGFLDLETPMLTKSTPEGARDYLVPSREYPGSFFALPQSPQIFKQLFMISGFDRYYQIVRCFRDEDLRADRQPEFTQLDVELAFVEQEDVLALNERLMSHIYKDVLDTDVQYPFERLTYEQAMEQYGSDKPDTRFNLQLVNISSIAQNINFEPYKKALEENGSIRGINAKNCGGYSRKKIDALGELAKYHKAKGLSYIIVQEADYKTPLSKFLSREELDKIAHAFEAEPGDLILIVADKDETVFEALSNLRLKIGQDEGLIEDKLNFLWVVDFPLLEWDEESKRYFAKHHPFTKYREDDFDLLTTNPGKVRSQAYDMVLNGMELGGGSMRINTIEDQNSMFKLLGFTEEEVCAQFGFLLEAFKYGAPPHGGIAYGLDRIVMAMAGADSIREVIAFPKVKDTSCPLTNAPGPAAKEQLDELGIKLEKVKTKGD